FGKRVVGGNCSKSLCRTRSLTLSFWALYVQSASLESGSGTISLRTLDALIRKAPPLTGSRLSGKILQVRIW
ncbi:hypothetical protein EDD22DRAFT_919271, partial [Suillus occidentalis]